MKDTHKDNNKQGRSGGEVTLLTSLANQLTLVNDLREFAFDDPRYADWRSETGQVLVKLFRPVDSEQHPCVKAFLNYRVPVHFSASRSEMQEYYRNILSYQADLLRTYLEDFEEMSRG